MKNRFNKNDLKNGMILTMSLCCVVLFSMLIGKIGVIFKGIGSFLKAMAPFMIGCAIAFLLNPIHTLLKKGFNKFFKKIKRLDKNSARVSNIMAVVFTMIIFFALIIGLLVILVPELKDSLVKLYEKIPQYITNTEEWAAKRLKDNEPLEKLVSSYLTDFENAITKFFNSKIIPNMDTIVTAVSTGIIGGVKVVINFVIGCIVAVYILASKDKLSSQGKKWIFSFFGKKKGTKALEVLDYVNSVFGGFINGKIVDSIIIGILCAIFCKAVSMPYATLISVVIGFTNIIPFFGPFIGAIPSAILVLVESPKMCIVFVIFVLILQQFDGNILGPLILGDSTGLSGLWVLFAIIVGGDLFGFPGMILGVPVFACIYTLLTIVLRDSLKKRGLTNATDFYSDLRGFTEEGRPIRGEKKKRESAKNRKKRMLAAAALERAKEKTGEFAHLGETFTEKLAHKHENINEGQEEEKKDKDKE